MIPWRFTLKTDSPLCCLGTSVIGNIFPVISIFLFHFQSSLQESGSGTGTDSGGTTPSPSYPNSTSASTWTNWPDPPGQTLQNQKHPVANYERPHTISSAYERHARPALTAQTFEPPEGHKLEQQQQIQQNQNQQLQQTQQRSTCQTAPSTPSPSPYAVPCIVPPKGFKGFIFITLQLNVCLLK